MERDIERRCDAARHRAARVGAWPAPRRPLAELAMFAVSLALCAAAVLGAF